MDIDGIIAVNQPRGHMGGGSKQCRLLSISAAAAKSSSSNSSSGGSAVNFHDSLLTLCRKAIVNTLERFPAEAFHVLDEEEFENLITLRHSRTTPLQGKGGLDGTGRLTPAVTDKWLAAVEAANPHLAESTVSDGLVWKDCVEYKFKSGGLTRPLALDCPWPVLVQRIQDTGISIQQLLVQLRQQQQQLQVMQQDVDRNDNQVLLAQQQLQQTWADLDKAVDTLCHKTPMNIKLLSETGIGKTVKKIIKSTMQQQQQQQQQQQLSDRERVVCNKLQSLLSSWMQLAASKGVEIKTSTCTAVAGSNAKNNNHKLNTKGGNMSAPPQRKNPPGTIASASPQSPALAAAAANTTSNTSTTMEEDLEIAEDVLTWRQLFHLLQQREEDRRSNQGKRMRERRQKLNDKRPHVVKVRPSAKQQAEQKRKLLLGGNNHHDNKSGSKIQSLRHEAAVSVARQSGKAAPPSSSSSSFSNAVAFASIGKKRGGGSGGASAAVLGKRPLSGSSSGGGTAGTVTVAGAGGKRMKIPTALGRKNGGIPTRGQFASKYANNNTTTTNNNNNTKK